MFSVAPNVSFALPSLPSIASKRPRLHLSSFRPPAIVSSRPHIRLIHQLHISHHARHSTSTCTLLSPSPSPPSHPSPPSTPPAPFWTAALAEALAAILGIVLCTVTHLPILGPHFALTQSALLNSILLTVPFSLLFWALEKLPSGITAATEARFRHFFLGRSPVDVALFCLSVAAGEELLFRSWLLPGLLELGLHPAPGLVLSALFFGGLHAYTPLYMLLASVAGFLLGAMFLATGSVLHPATVHFLYDFATILVMQRRWRGPSSASSE